MSADFTPEKEDYKILKPFKMQVLTNFPYIEADFDALTNYELLCKVVEYLNAVIHNENEVTEQVNSLYNAYVSLQAYVNSYFDNLDVQEEINNKLDEMAESGELTDIIAQYLGLAGMITFNNVAEMKLAENLVNGSKCATLGYNNVKDGGNAFYKIRTITNEDVVDEHLIIALYNPLLIAELVNLEVTPEMFGAYGDGTHDDTQAFSDAIDSNRTIKCYGNKTYIINELIIDDKLDMYGNGATLKASEECDYIIKLTCQNNEYNGIIDGFTFDGDNKANDCILNDNSFRRVIRNCNLVNPVVNGFHSINLGGGTRLESINGKVNPARDDTTFLKLESSDINVNNADYINYHVGLYSSGNSQINQFHGFIDSPIYEDSKFIHLNGGRLVATNVYPDTQQFWFYISTIGDYRIIGGESWHNMQVDDTQIEGTTAGNEYVVFTENTTGPNLRRFHLVDFILSTPADLTKILFSNSTMGFDTTGTQTTRDTKIPYHRWVSGDKSDMYFTKLNTDKIENHLVVTVEDNYLCISGYVKFLDAFTGQNYVDVLAPTLELMSPNLNTYYGALKGTNITNAVSSDVKWIIGDLVDSNEYRRKLTIAKLQGTDLTNQLIYIVDKIKYICIK